jgi:hypothetical protein
MAKKIKKNEEPLKVIQENCQYCHQSTNGSGGADTQYCGAALTRILNTQCVTVLGATTCWVCTEGAS